MLYLSEINVYPVKSLAGIPLIEARVQRRGLQHDRRWMLVEPDGKFVTQREIPAMALLQPALDGDSLRIHPKNEAGAGVAVPQDPSREFWPSRMVEVWSSRYRAWQAPGQVNEWFSDHLGRALQLVYMPDTTRRATDGRYTPRGQYVSFADADPYLVIGQASLDDLNGRLSEPLPMNRFRPNFVFTGAEPYAEDEWTDFLIGDLPFRGVKNCARCIITTTDQETGDRGKEPLKTLATYRKLGQKILFGRDAVWMGEEEAMVRVGMEVRLKLAFENGPEQ